MRVFTNNNADESCVEVLFNYRELNEFVDSLVKFKSKIEQYKQDSGTKNGLGFTHIHFKDCSHIGKNSKDDIVFYVDLNDE